jgi:serine/threonine protein kinase
VDYEPIARLGRGGMGVVDLARDAEGNRVALKRLTLHGSASEIARARQRLMREADMLSRLRHPNIVRLIEVVDDGDEVVLVMPYLSAGSLAERVTQHGPAPTADVERLGELLLGALVAAHQAGIIHRDIKPGNVLYDSADEPMLADFGLAHSWDQTHGLTVTGMVVGTPGYMSPEQARDEPLTPATDIFALGATLLYAATGNGPYGNGDPGLLMVRASGGEVEPLPQQLPEHMRGWLSSMLDPQPEYRPTAAALLTGYGLPRRRSKARWLRPRNIVAGTTLAALGTVAWMWRSGDSSDGDSAAIEEPGALDSGSEPAPEPGKPGAGPEPDDGGVDTEGASPGNTTIPNGWEVLTDELSGTFTRPGEELVIAIPPLRSDDECDVQVDLHLEVVDTDAAIRLTILDETGEELTTVVGELGEPASTSFQQRVCPEPGQMLRAELAPVDPDVSEGSYVLTRENTS